MQLRVGNLWHPQSYFSFAGSDDPEISGLLDFYGISSHIGPDLGSILQNYISAQNFSDKFLDKVPSKSNRYTFVSVLRTVL
jgi:hypothetical protein